MKYLKLSWVLVLALSLSLTSCSSNDDNDGGGTPSVVKVPVKVTAYDYGEGSTTPTDIEIAQYKYNADNSIAEMDEDGMVMKFVYNANGQLTEVNHYNSETPTTISYKETFTYSTDKVLYSSGSVGYVYPYMNVFSNANGKVVKKASYDSQSSYYREMLYTYDAKGNIVKEEYNEKEDGVFEPTRTITFGYDNRAGVFSKVKLSAPWMTCSEWSSYWYVDTYLANNATSMQSGDESGTVTYDYDTDGYPTQMKVGGLVIQEFEYKTITQ